MATSTAVRVSAETRGRVASLARVHNVTQVEFLDRLVAEAWERDFWARMEPGDYDDADLAELAEQEATYAADFEAAQ